MQCALFRHLVVLPFFHLSQRKNLLQYWRNFATWIGANCERKDRLIAKVQQLNEGSKAREAPVRVEPFRSKGGLIYSDYYDLGTYVLGLKTAKSDTISLKLEELRFKRMVHYHVFGAPADRVHPEMSMPLFLGRADLSNFFFLFAGTESTVAYLMKVLPYKALSTVYWGGGTWSRLKADENELPDWELLCRSDLWVLSSQYGEVQRYLRGEFMAIHPAKSPPVAPSASPGAVQHTKVRATPDSLEKIVFVGPPKATMESCKATVLWLDVQRWERLPSEILHMLQSNAKLNVLLVGASEDVDKAESLIRAVAGRPM